MANFLYPLILILTLTACSRMDLNTNKATLNFASSAQRVVTMTTPTEATITLTNTGAFSATKLRVQDTLQSTGLFTMKASNDPDACAGGVAPRASCQLTVTVAAAAAQGGDATLGLSYESNGETISSQLSFSIVPYQSGALDTRFGTGGTYAFALGTNPNNQVYRMALTPTGSLLVIGSAATVRSDVDIFVQKITPTGTLDTSFGTGGTVITDIANNNDRPYGIALQADGKFIVTGESNPIPSGSRVSFVNRYLANGTLDTTFGTNGIVQLSVSGTDHIFYRPSIQPDGKILVVGNGNVLSGSEYDPLVFRLDTDGNPDPTFGTNGLAIISHPGSTDYTFNVTQMSNGKIFVSAISTGTPRTSTLFRILPDGSVDPSWNSTGLATYVNGGVNMGGGNAPVLLSDGSLLFGTYVSSPVQCSITRINADATIDTTYGTAGWFTRSSVSAPTMCPVALRNGEKSVFTEAQISSGTFKNISLVGLTRDGALDTSFGAAQTGVVNLTLLANDLPTDLLADANSRLYVLANSSDVSGNRRFSITKVTQ